MQRKCKNFSECGKTVFQFSTTDNLCFECKKAKMKSPPKRCGTFDLRKPKQNLCKPTHNYAKLRKKPIQSRYRKDPKLEEWHEKIRKRAGYVCEVDGKPFPPEQLCGDHILTRGAYPEFKYDPDNGVCVCLEHHNKRGTGEIDIKTHPAYKSRYDIMMEKVSKRHSDDSRNTGLG